MAKKEKEEKSKVKVEVEDSGVKVEVEDSGVKVEVAGEAAETEAEEEVVEGSKEAVEETEAVAEGADESEKKEKKDKKDAIIEELNDRVKRQMAEFENFRKRTEKEKASMYDMGAVAVLEKMLPVIDNFERGLESAGDDAFSEGMKMIYKQLMTSLDEMGVRLIPAVGETFDPELHNAVMHEESEDAGEGEITQELQKGYTYHDAVIRHSMVKVAN